jgi:hypothetical protein
MDTFESEGETVFNAPKCNIGRTHEGLVRTAGETHEFVLLNDVRAVESV